MFARVSSLKRQHVCQECDKRFTRAGDLKKHMLIHTGDNKYVCPECDKRFAQAGHLKRHKLTHKKKLKTCMSRL